MTTTSNNPVDPSAEDLLQVFDSFPIKKESIIPDADLQFCREQQKVLYESLDKIKRWYDIFCGEAEQYRETHNLSYSPDGILNFREYFRDHDYMSPDYRKFEFKPFDVINQLAENRFAAIRSFAGKIVGYFNHKYNVSIPAPVPETEKFALDFRPVYTDYTFLVEKYLQGKGFRETAEEEIITRFHKTICHRNWSEKTPQLKLNRIIFHGIVHFDEFYFQYNKNHIHHNYQNRLPVLCEGLAFGTTDSLHGNNSIILNFDENDVNVNKTYSLVCGAAQEIKFYKNGRIDVYFTNAESAKRCFDKLRLSELNQLNNE